MSSSTYTANYAARGGSQPVDISEMDIKDDDEDFDETEGKPEKNALEEDDDAEDTNLLGSLSGSVSSMVEGTASLLFNPVNNIVSDIVDLASVPIAVARSPTPY